VLARIRLGERIGRGGMAEVFAAQLVGPAGFEKDVAVKRILPRFAHDPIFLERFLNEARLAARLSHPNIVQIFELGHDGQDHYIVMEAVRGKSLRGVHERLSELGERCPREVALHVAQSLCAGLAHADEQLGLIHRDVSPHNVLLSFDGAVKLIDFGIARVQSDDRLTQVGQVLGKLRYMSPEQVTGDDIDRRSDVFAVGVLLFQMLTGRLPFDGKDEREIAERIRDGKRSRVRELAPDVEQPLADVVERALAVEREDRFESARAMGGALVAAASSIRHGPLDVETMMRGLFPDEVSRAWPTEDLRSDGADRTQTSARREITISSEGSNDDEAPAPSPLAALPPTVADASGTWQPSDGATLDELLDPFPTRRALLIAAAITLTGAGAFAFFRTRSPAGGGAGAADPGASARAPDEDRDGDVGAAREPPIEPPLEPGLDPDLDPDLDPELEPGDDAPPVAAGAAEPADRPRRRPARRPARLGRLIVETRPWTVVKLDGRRVGVTPLAVEVPVGAHKLLLENKETGLRRELEVRIQADEPTVLRLDLRK
jgi:eukaryotic-like serine/threonine-protein kinase